jgi:hypothetical protein
MDIRRWLLRYAAVAIAFATTSATDRHPLKGSEMTLAQTSSQEKTFEMQVSLFVQDPHFASGKRAIQVIWVPQQIQKYCLGKTDKECSTIDYCIRTTNKHASTCQNLSMDTTRLPAYPPDGFPRRVLSIVYFFPISTEKGFGSLAAFFENAPKGSLDRLSANARIQAKVKLTRSADDDQFDVLEILAVP